MSRAPSASAAIAALLLGLASPSAPAATVVPPVDRRSAPAPEAQGPSEHRTPPVEEAARSTPHRLARRPRPFLRWIVASHGDDLELVDVDDVRFFRSDSKYTLVAAADRDLLIRKSVKELVSTLDPAAFWQVHRSTVVNVAMVASVSHGADGRLVLHLRDRPELLHVSRRYAQRFHRM